MAAYCVPERTDRMARRRILGGPGLRAGDRLDTEIGEPITTEQLRYGQHVTVLGSTSSKLRTPQALGYWPQAFGYREATYVPMVKTLVWGLNSFWREQHAANDRR
jgi:hypothetical protein